MTSSILLTATTDDGDVLLSISIDVSDAQGDLDSLLSDIEQAALRHAQ